MPTYTTQAICLASRNSREADRIVTLYSPDVGRVDAVVRGARRETSKLRAACDVLGHLDVQLARRAFATPGPETLCQVQSRATFSTMRGDLLRLACGMLCAEWVQRFAASHGSHEIDESQTVFGLLLKTLHALDTPTLSPDPLSQTIHFQLGLLETTGYMPQWEFCVRCRQSVEAPPEGWLWFSSEQGGVVCPACAQPVAPPGSVQASWHTLTFLREVITDANATPPKPDTPLRALRLLHWDATHKLGQPLKAMAFLLEVAHVPSGHAAVQTSSGHAVA